MLESISYDGEVYIVALHSTDNGPESRKPRRIYRTRRLLRCLHMPDVKLLFRTGGTGLFDPPGSDSEHPTALPASVRFRGPIDGGIGLPWGRLASLAEYATREDVSPDAPGLFRDYCSLGSLGVRLGTYQRELGGVKMYQAFMTWPGPLGVYPGLRTGGLLCAVSCDRPEGVLSSYAHPAVAVCLHGPGSAGFAQGYITSLGGPTEALAAPGAVASFARGFLHAPTLGSSWVTGRTT